MKSRMGAARGNIPILGGSNGARAEDRGNKKRNSVRNKQCLADPTGVMTHSKSPVDFDPCVNSSSQSGSWGAKPTGRDIADCDSHSVQVRANHLDTFV